MRAHWSFFVHVEEVALLCPGFATSPLRPGGQAREARGVSGAPPRLHFPYKGSEVVEHWTEAGREQSPQTTNLGPSFHSCSVASPDPVFQGTGQSTQRGTQQRLTQPCLGNFCQILRFSLKQEASFTLPVAALSCLNKGQVNKPT